MFTCRPHRMHSVDATYRPTDGVASVRQSSQLIAYWPRPCVCDLRRWLNRSRCQGTFPAVDIQSHACGMMRHAAMRLFAAVTADDRRLHSHHPRCDETRQFCGSVNWPRRASNHPCCCNSCCVYCNYGRRPSQLNSAKQADQHLLIWPAAGCRSKSVPMKNPTG